MEEALIAVGFLLLAAIMGTLLSPTEDQLRPLTPQSSGEGGHSHQDEHNHGHV
jgi:hypothetical protein